MVFVPNEGVGLPISRARTHVAWRGAACRCGADHVGSHVQLGADQNKWGAPIVCNDGVAIAKEVDLENPEANFGAQMLRPAENTGEAVGDGTSTRSSGSRSLAAHCSRSRPVV
jgi:hypothetical protein